MKIGDIIKSYDFRACKDFYMIGRVIEINDEFIKCSLIKAVSGSKEYNPKIDEFETAKAGSLFMDWEGRIEILG